MIRSPEELDAFIGLLRQLMQLVAETLTLIYW